MNLPFETMILITVVAVLVFTTLIALLTRYRKCPSDNIMVIYGKVGQDATGQRSSKCVHGGAAFIWPVFQSYEFLSLTPISINVDLRNALSKQNIRIDVPSRFTVGISTEPGVMQNAAERLLGLKQDEVEALAMDIIFGQLRLVVATMDIEEINTDRDKFLDAVSRNVETELKKIGLRLINVNVTDIKDESGYIEALGKEAAAKAINDAKKSVAEKNRDGAIGEAEAKMDERIRVTKANATAIEGENTAKVTVANSDATRREREADANSRATAAEKVAVAMALKQAYDAEEGAERARASREMATAEANEIVQAEINKRKMEIDAEARAEQIRRQARGEADAIYAKLEAQARGVQELLKKQADGYGALVAATNGNPDQVVKLMIADKIEELVKIQVEAVKNLKIDKVTVWDGMGQNGSSTANFASGLMKSLPPLNDLFAMAGMALPEVLGKSLPEKPVLAKTVEDAASTAAEAAAKA
jgi:flotillin